jgi:hypothetical protein
MKIRNLRTMLSAVLIELLPLLVFFTYNQFIQRVKELANRGSLVSMVRLQFTKVAIHKKMFIFTNPGVNLINFLGVDLLTLFVSNTILLLEDFFSLSALKRSCSLIIK